MSAININKENFDRLSNESKPILLDFYADWCPSCKVIAPAIESIAKEREDIIVGKVNVGNELEIASRFGVSSIPMLVVMKDGKVIKRSVGARPKSQILDLIPN